MIEPVTPRIRSQPERRKPNNFNLSSSALKMAFEDDPQPPETISSTKSDASRIRRNHHCR